MYPFIRLNIKNNVPTITYHPNSETSKTLTEVEENLEELMFKLANKLEIDLDSYDELLEHARSADETYLMTEHDLDDDLTKFNLENLIKEQFKQALEERQDFNELATASDELKQELQNNEHADIFASILDSIYSILIAKTVLAASDLGLGNIHLNDVTGNPRLREKMAQELEKMNLELIITE